MAEVFQVNHLTFFYPEQPDPVIRDLSLTVEQGEFLDRKSTRLNSSHMA